MVFKSIYCQHPHSCFSHSVSGFRERFVKGIFVNLLIKFLAHILSDLDVQT